MILESHEIVLPQPFWSYFTDWRFTRAPKLKCKRSLKGIVEDVSIQSFLQDAFVEAFGRLSDEIGDLEACLGFNPINEPHRGLINLHDFHGFNYATDLHIGHYPSFAEALALSVGRTCIFSICRVPTWLCI